ncbi:MAG: hypothetical protein DHS20C15_14570 [Planctomycetota bacterium]|nr:MAG: hypothetical protein DHS20C15_14570 [Planctomycetota bacterium]
MTSFKSVLVPLDLAAAGAMGHTAEIEAALDQARWIAEASGATLCLMSVVQDAEAAVLELLEHRLRSLADARLAGLDVTVHASAGKPFVDIVRKVTRDGHDLVVVGPRAAHRRHAGLVGSTALTLLRKCPSAVWVATRPGTGKPAVVLSAVAMHSTMPSILKLSAEICTESEAAWHVLHVPEYPAEGGMRLRGVDAETLEAYQKEVRDAGWTDLHKAVDPVATKYKLTPKLWMSEGLASEKIDEAAKELSADVVVMGTVARHGLGGLLLGSTAEKVCSRIETGLLVVKPDDFVSPISAE